MKTTRNLLLPGLLGAFLLAQSALAQSPVTLVVDPALAGPNISSNSSAINLRAYAVLAQDKTVHLTLINKEHGPDRREVEINLAPVHHYTRGQAMLLAAPAGDVAAQTGVMLGGAAIDHYGIWSGDWTPLAAASGTGQFKLKLPAATAAIVKLKLD